jgi:hypothetical protein
VVDDPKVESSERSVRGLCGYCGYEVNWTLVPGYGSIVHR